MTTVHRTAQGSPEASQRRPEYKREDEWIRDFLRRGQIAHVATVVEGQPFVTPTTYLFEEANHRLIFHSNIAGRLRSNVEAQPKVAAEVSELGRLLPSNVALEFSLQYRSVVVFGRAQVLSDGEEKRAAMHGLIAKYFSDLAPGKDYRGATDKELKRTTVYALQIESWSGKENWKDRADQSDEWPALDDKHLA